jgi:hypothetical protein
MPLSILYLNKYGTLFENLGPSPEPYTNKKGETITLNRWKAQCKFCGADFELLYSSRLNPAAGWNTAFNRNACEDHRDRHRFKV